MVPKEVPFANTSTVEEASAVPDIAGLLLLVEVPVVGDVMTGLAGAEASIFIVTLSDTGDVLPVESVDVAVRL